MYIYSIYIYICMDLCNLSGAQKPISSHEQGETRPTRAQGMHVREGSLEAITLSRASILILYEGCFGTSSVPP